jgi:hypothetical protein
VLISVIDVFIFVILFVIEETDKFAYDISVESLVSKFVMDVLSDEERV